MTSLFDTPDFNARLFFPRDDVSLAPPGARDDLVEVAPGIRLHVRTHPARSARAQLLLFHGNGEVVADYDALAPDYAAAGARLAVMDYRGYGKSGGAPTLRAALEDAVTIAAAVRATSALPLVIMGRSLGSACAAELARRAPTPAGVILESGFSDLHGLLRRRGLAHDASIPPADLEAFEPLRKLRASTAPLLVLHGAKDTLIPPAEGVAAHDAAGTADKRLVLIPDRGHNDVSFHPLYWEVLGAWLSHVTGG